MKNQIYAFVVRVWLESTYGDGRVPVWRGSIEQVGSDGRTYFSDLDGIGRYIQKQIEQEGLPPPAQRKLTLEHVQDGLRNFWKRLLHRNS